MAKVLVIDFNHGESAHSTARRVCARLQASPSVETCERVEEEGKNYDALFVKKEADALVYFPTVGGGRRAVLDLKEAEQVLAACAAAAIAQVVVVSSAAVYGARPQNPGFIAESRPRSQNGKDWYGGINSVALQWMALEDLVQKCLGDHPARLAILRPAAVLAQGGVHYLSRLFAARRAVTLPGHDPSLQLLGSDDLAAAVCAAVEKAAVGVYNVAPSAVVPLRVALRLAGIRRLPLPRWLQRLARPLLTPLGLAFSKDQLEYLRYSWTVSNDKIKRELDFVPPRSSVAVLQDFLAAQVPDIFIRQVSPRAGREFDGFGMDKNYIAAYGRTLFKFLQRYYWRIEVRGLEHVPAEGRAVLAGVHRGFMPWDAVMTFHLVVQGTGRYPRFLIHPTLIKFPFQFNFITKLGGVIAGRENADRVLGQDELLGFYPEGIHGAFTPYRDAYGLGKFGRNEFVKTALRNRAPIVPFVTVGSPEIFPILGKIDWPWWKRLTQWPFFPLAPPFPLLPLPLPSKWHTRFLEPLHIEERYPPEKADDAAVVREISREVRDRMQQAVEEMLSRRTSIFFGSVFEGGRG